MSSRLDAGRLLCVGLSGPRLTAMERRLIRRLRPGGIILFGDNYESLEQLKELCAAIRKACDPAPLISVDQEGGRVVRFGEPFTHLPPARQLAREHSPRKLTAIAEKAGRELHDAGIDIDFVPVLDVLTNRANQVISDRAFGSDAATVRRFAVPFMRGLMKSGVIPCGKHFPGHGGVREDSHFELPVSRTTPRSLFDVHLKPFVAAIRAGLPMILVAHVMFLSLDPDLPASLSRPIVRGLLREKLKFKGVMVTDDLRMRALEKFGDLAERSALALEAGHDWLLLGDPIEEVEAPFRTVESWGKAHPDLVRASVHRIAALK